MLRKDRAMSGSDTVAVDAESGPAPRHIAPRHAGRRPSSRSSSRS
ncbi:hypothetical protein LX15_006142, partial [Streptoalloteichus tenebrarius]|nr:hypothetical protein [Streptoalloteichus tenebrarius]